MSRTIPVYRLQLNRSASVSGLPRACENPRDAYEVFKAHLGDPDREHLLAIYLDWRRHVLGLHVAAIGNRNLLHSEAREVFSTGLHWIGAQAFRVKQQSDQSSVPRTPRAKEKKPGLQG